jgi:hypothetical protein
MHVHARDRPSLLEAPPRLAVALLAVLSSGCAGAPSTTVAGAFFPAWLVCALIGALAAVLVRVIFVATGLAQTLPLQLLVCLSAGLLCGAMAWTLWIRW